MKLGRKSSAYFGVGVELKKGSRNSWNPLATGKSGHDCCLSQDSRTLTEKNYGVHAESQKTVLFRLTFEK